MKGAVFIVAGAPQTGKSTLVKSYVAKAHKDALHIFDVQGDYKQWYNKKFTGDLSSFIEEAAIIRDSLIVFEEATGFVSTQGGTMKLKQVMLSAKGHRHNLVFINFHSLRKVPLDIFELADYIVLFKTADTLENIDKKFDHPELIEAFKKIRAAPMIKKGDKTFSPHLIIPVIGHI